MGLLQGLATGDGHQSTAVTSNPVDNPGNGHVGSPVIRVAGIAIGAAQVAPGKSNEHAGKTGMHGFALDAEKKFINSECEKDLR